MRTFLVVLMLSGLISNLSGQQVASGISEKKFISITKDPPKPPYLEIEQSSLQFTDSDGNNKIDANENSFIRFKLKNTGSGDGLGLKLQVQEQNQISGIGFDKERSLGTLQPGKSMDVELPLSGLMSLQEGVASFKLWVDEANNFDSDPVSIDVSTWPFQSPWVKIMDNKVSSEQGTTLQKKRPFDFQVLVQNLGQGIATQVRVNLQMPENVLCLSSNESFLVGNLTPGESRIIEYSLITNNDFVSETIPLEIKVEETFGKYAENKVITLRLNQEISDAKLVVKGKEDLKREIQLASLTSEVDKNIPANPVKNKNRIALIIGNENYSNNLLNGVNVDFATNDARVFRDYAVDLLGVEENNVYLLLDATAGRMQSNLELVVQRLMRMGPLGELIFYYAGHGLPDESLSAPYLIPIDVDATNLASAVKLADVYRKFSQTQAGRITIFLDACFSGGGRSGALLAARKVAIKPREETITGNLIAFSASSGEQSALPYQEKKHGMFTYYLLKKLQESQGNITYKDLADYLKKEVGLESLSVNRKVQDPEVRVSQEIAGKWELWRFR